MKTYIFLYVSTGNRTSDPSLSNLTLVYLKALATVQGSGYSFKKTWLQSKMADLPESYTTNAHFTEVTLSMPIWYT